MPIPSVWDVLDQRTFKYLTRAINYPELLVVGHDLFDNPLRNIYVVTDFWDDAEGWRRGVIAQEQPINNSEDPRVVSLRAAALKAHAMVQGGCLDMHGSDLDVLLCVVRCNH